MRAVIARDIRIDIDVPDPCPPLIVRRFAGVYKAQVLAAYSRSLWWVLGRKPILIPNIELRDVPVRVYYNAGDGDGLSNHGS